MTKDHRVHDELVEQVGVELDELRRAGDQLDDAIATLVRTVERAIAAHAALGSAAP